MSNLNSYPLSYKAFGKSALLIEWPNQIDQHILNDILQFQSCIEVELRDFLVETVNAYNSLTIVFYPDIISLNEIQQKIQSLYPSKPSIAKQGGNTWKIPVCYDKEFGIDLEDVASQNELTVDEIIATHCKAEYTIYFIGFLPGFLYLGGLPKVIHTPRKSTPRLRIKKGAVAIGGEQTGIYPFESPGGWNIIGNSPLQFFNPKLNPPCFTHAGDVLRFYPIGKKEHQEILNEVERGVFTIESKSL